MIPVLAFLVDLLKFTLAGTAVFFIAYYFIKSEMDKQRQLKLLELRKAALNTTLPLRLQAHERMALFVERINPSSLLVRMHVPGTNAAELQKILVTEIQNEFQHNVTQQIYLSDLAWNILRRVKDDTISLINNSARGLSAEASSLELSKVILMHLSSLEESPYDAALSIIRSDLQDVI